MPTLALSTLSLPAGPALAGAARAAGWDVIALDAHKTPPVSPPVIFYGGTDVVEAAADRFGLALLEPPLDLLARLPAEFRQRNVEFARFHELRRLKAPAFVKPADALRKVFDAGTYSDPRQIRAPRGVSADTPVLVAEPVEWLAEYRCFILDGKVVTSSPYLSFGRPVWHPHGERGAAAAECKPALAFCERLRSAMKGQLPPAYVVDVGVIEDRGWAAVEFNPVWCSGVLGADPRRVLDVLARACPSRETASDEDRRWLVAR